MTRILVLYHSMYGHIDTLARSVAEGAREVEGVEVTLNRVPETMDAEAQLEQLATVHPRGSEVACHVRTPAQGVGGLVTSLWI